MISPQSSNYDSSTLRCHNEGYNGNEAMGKRVMYANDNPFTLDDSMIRRTKMYQLGARTYSQNANVIFS